MTSATLPTPAGARAAHANIPIARLVNVELRKMIDTRAGRWLLIGAVALIAVVLGIMLATVDGASGRSFVELLRIAQIPVLALMPVIGVLAATSEWSQRTTLSTFSLIPARGRVLTAKIIAALLLSTVATLVVIVMTAVAAVIAPITGATQSDWGFGISDFGELLTYQWLSMLLGLSLGTALLNPALAIVLFFALPTIWSGLTIAFKWETLQLWLDSGMSWDRLSSTEPMTGLWWARVGTTALLWVVLPLSIGTARILRREVD
jgi:ABC-2 type transport system permease protein